MIKRIVLTILTIVLVFSLCACGNRDMSDIVRTFDRVIVKLADGSIVEGKCQDWRRYSNNGMVQVKVNDKIYLIHSVNCTLIAE